MRGPRIACLLLGLVAGSAEADETARGGAAVEQGNVQKMHTRFSAECFNQCWTFIDKSERSPKDVENMLLLAHASLWHWKQRTDCKPVNLSVGYWQVSRVYALSGQYDLAKSFAEKCLAIGQESRLGPFYLGYGYEALARAEVLHKDMTKARALLAKARGEAEKIVDKDERGLLDADLVSIEKTIPSR